MGIERSQGAQDAIPATQQQLLAIAGVALLHVTVYYAVTRLTLLRPPESFINPHLALDDLIPHLAWTWPAYWLPYLMVPIAAGAAMRKLSAPAFGRLITAWSAMIIIGGAIQVAYPAVAPWPTAPALSQRIYHDSPLVLPYATLPSMHVAHIAMAGLTAGTAFASSLVRGAGILLTLVVAAATLTLKEHVLLDGLSGLALALGTWHWWRRGLR